MREEADGWWNNINRCVVRTLQTDTLLVLSVCYFNMIHSCHNISNIFLAS